MAVAADSEHPATSTKRRSPNPTRRNEATRRAILDAALDLVVASGFEALTIEEIARRAGVGKQTIYRWWPSKGAVLLEAFLDNRVEQRAGTPLLGSLDRGDFAADVRRVIRGSVKAFATASWEAPYRALTIAIQEDPQLGAAASEHLIKPSLDDVRAWLAAAQGRGDVRPDIDLDVAVELLLAPIFHRWLLRTGPLSASYADALADAVVRALTT
jgi:AcrR family transcriptional regulator